MLIAFGERQLLEELSRRMKVLYENAHALLETELGQNDVAAEENLFGAADSQWLVLRRARPFQQSAGTNGNGARRHRGAKLREIFCESGFQFDEDS